MKLSNLLRNKTVLYVVLFLAITNIVGYIYVQNFEAIIFFLAVAYLSTYFSRNMIVNLAVPILVTNTIFTRRGVYEGMENEKEEKGKGEEGEEGETEEMTNKHKQPEKKKQKQKFSNRKLSPAPVNKDKDEQVTGKHIDYSSTLEQAYDNLENIMGDGGMKNLTKDTHDLIKQQKSLMKTMQSMAPILKNANSVLSNVNMEGMGEGMEKITSLLSGFSSKQ